ncbi:MAG TPA: hypothetical protein VKZ53_27335 [Candidatus Angelobacter sp.]|nr:hypothetical protein [Candidatus Angelobacter sp.]
MAVSMPARFTEIKDQLRESGMTGRPFATILVVSSRYTIWPMYLWLRTAWNGIGSPTAYTWIVSIPYFSLWLWLLVLLDRNEKQYRGMVMHSFFGGSLLTLAVALHEPVVRMVLTQIGFGWAAWVAFLGGLGFIFATSAQAGREQRQAP